MNKLVHALFSFHPTDKISISHIQRLASLLSRVSILSRHMRPYTHTLHSLSSGYVYPHAKIHLSILAQSDIMMWRAFVLLLIANPSKLSRPMESFRRHQAIIIRYDASLTGLGVGLYEMQNNRLVIYTALSLPFSVGNDSSNQNTMEFTAVVLGLLLAFCFGFVCCVCSSSFGLVVFVWFGFLCLGPCPGFPPGLSVCC